MNWIDVIYQKLNIEETYELPDKLLSTLLIEEDKNKLFDECLKVEDDLSKDYFREYFEVNESDRKKLKQDYTPECIAKFIGKLVSDGHKSIIDVCSGTGGLILGVLNYHPNLTVYAEELSGASIPLLLFNLAIRNIEAVVTQGDSLKRDYQKIYKLDKGERFSTIRETEEYEYPKSSLVVMNPPYSAKWEPAEDERFEDYGLAPKSKADYAFLLHGLSMLEEDGELLAILPHGVLFRRAQEGQIRKKLTEKGFIDTILGLPDNLFLNTSIPAMIMKLKKKGTDKTLFIDGSKECQKNKNKNIMTDENIDKLISTVKKRGNINRLSSLVSIQDMTDNDYNLNIPRYVDTFEPEEPIDGKEVLENIKKIDEDIYKVSKELLGFVDELKAEEDEDKEVLEIFKDMLTADVKSYEYGKGLFDGKV